MTIRSIVMKGDEKVAIPDRFWSVLSESECDRVMQKGVLNTRLSELLWAMLERADEPPRRPRVFISRADMLRHFPVINQ